MQLAKPSNAAFIFVQSSARKNRRQELLHRGAESLAMTAMLL